MHLPHLAREACQPLVRPPDTDRPEGRGALSRDELPPTWAVQDSLRAEAGAGGAVSWAGRASEAAGGLAMAADEEFSPPVRLPRLLVAGPRGGVLDVLVHHLAGEGRWSVETAPSPEQARLLLREVRPDVLLATWAGDWRTEGAMTAWLDAVRRQQLGPRLPVVLLGTPALAGATPMQPMRGVLCLPRPLKWRTLFLCLDEHWRAWNCRRLRGGN